jgi:hypothetical protein
MPATHYVCPAEGIERGMIGLADLLRCSDGSSLLCGDDCDAQHLQAAIAGSGVSIRLEDEDMLDNGFNMSRRMRRLLLGCCP